jgi:hypothetical protein
MGSSIIDHRLCRNPGYQDPREVVPLGSSTPNRVEEHLELHVFSQVLYFRHTIVPLPPVDDSDAMSL